MVEHQVLEERYLDKDKLIKLLRRLFGAGNFEIEVNATSNSIAAVVMLMPLLVQDTGRRVWPYSSSTLNSGISITVYSHKPRLELMRQHTERDQGGQEKFLITVRFRIRELVQVSERRVIWVMCPGKPSVACSSYCDEQWLTIKHQNGWKYLYSYWAVVSWSYVPLIVFAYPQMHLFKLRGAKYGL